MDMVKIGGFLAELRHEKALTQEELGEKLGVTNKTVSRWEKGNYMPPAEMLLALSELYDVSINEILTGRRLKDAEFKSAAEENLTAAISEGAFTAKERMHFFRQKWLRENRASLFAEIVAVIAALII